MRMPVIILLISCIYTGCGSHREFAAVTVIQDDLPPVGSVRVVLPEGVPAGPGAGYAFLGELFLRSLCSAGLMMEDAEGRLAPAIASDWSLESDGLCWRFEFNEDYAVSEGEPLTPRMLAEHWESRLDGGDHSLEFLLRPVSGIGEFLSGQTAHIAGIRCDDRGMTICTADPAPGFDRRMAQAGAWMIGNGALSPGPFILHPERFTAVSSPWFPETTALKEVRWIDAGSADPAFLLVSGQADLAVTYGRSVELLMNKGGDRFETVRLPAWDRTYALWVNARDRWLSDRSFSRWLGERVDRQAILDYLFAGRGTPVRTIRKQGGEQSAPAADDRRPFSSGARPRLSLEYDSADRYGMAVASRIKAGLEQAGVLVELVESGREGRSASMALIAHQPPTADHLLGLWYTLQGLGEDAATAGSALSAASAGADPASRSVLADLVIASLESEYRLIPLVTIEAWLAHDGGLSGVKGGPAGILRLQGAGWREEAR